MQASESILFYDTYFCHIRKSFRRISKSMTNDNKCTLIAFILGRHDYRAVNTSFCIHLHPATAKGSNLV
jgi:hypothetical protein